MNISKKELTSCFINAAARSFRAENYQTVVFLFYSFKFARLNNCFYQVSVSAFVCSFWIIKISLFSKNDVLLQRKFLQYVSTYSCSTFSTLFTTTCLGSSISTARTHGSLVSTVLGALKQCLPSDLISMLKLQDVSVCVFVERTCTQT